MKQLCTAIACVALSLAAVGVTGAGAAETLKCGGTKTVENPDSFNSPATYKIRATGVTCERAKKFIKKYLATYNPPDAPYGFRCKQSAAPKDRAHEVCKKDAKKITFDRDGIG